MGAGAEVFHAVDALFTAITARDEALLSQCEQRLHAFRDAGEMPADASTYLDRIIRKARAGGWEAAAETLYAFMKAQRREGTRDREPTKQTPRLRRTKAAACALAPARTKTRR
ncbi:MAG TPA: hypothetical protein VN688_24455 [Gemmataceae bacterium]|nr:hypothetical protein [Gemmataceae bacterium]